MPLVIQWNRRAIKQFDDAITFIQNDSPANAEKFKRDILHKIDRLLKYLKNILRTNSRQTMTEASEHLNYIATEFHTGIRIIKYVL